MEIKISDKYKAAIKWWSIKKCKSVKNWLFQYRDYSRYFGNRAGFEVRVLGLGFGIWINKN